MVYRWRENTRFNVSAEVVGQRIDAIRNQKGGTIDAADIVEDARTGDSPLHPMFEWNDTEAANKYRLVQARTIICHIMTVPEENPAVGPQRAFVNVVEDRRTFTSMERAMSSPDLRKQVVRAAMNEAKAWRMRYAAYKELASIHAAIDEVAPVMAK